MNVLDYKHRISVNMPKGDDIYLMLLSNKDGGMVEDFINGRMPNEYEDAFLHRIGSVLWSEFVENEHPVIGFVDVDTKRSRNGFSIFPLKSMEMTDYNFPDPNTLPPYEEMAIDD